MQNVPKEYLDVLVDIIKNDEAAHILWLCGEEKSFSLGKKRLVPDGVRDPLDYMSENGIIADESMEAFNVLAAHIEEGIISGTDRNSVFADVKMKMSPEEDFAWCYISALFLLDENSRVGAVYLRVRRFSPLQEFRKNLLLELTTDHAPNLINLRCRTMFEEHPDENIAFIQFDIERFKLINEIHGADIGDEILTFIRDSLSVICGDKIMFVHLAADVFMVVSTFETEDDIVAFIRRIESMIVGYKGLDYRLVFGVSVVEDKTIHPRRMIDYSALARKKAHGNALNNIGWYNGALKSELEKRHSIEDDMHKAFVKNEFLMYLQPKYCISSNRIIGAEALTRWNHTKKGMIPPSDFIPVFEANGFILKLDQFMWERACKQIRDWLDRGIKAVPISVNISRQYVHSFNVIKYISCLVKKYDIPIHLLELEITESVDSFGVDEIVSQMKDAGFKMLMDDFGSGYSSLNMLKKTQFDVLKIDREFFAEFMESDRGRKIISHTISMSQDIGIDIMAEGVETSEQARFLEKCGCDIAQGFFYSKPIPAEEFEKLLIETNK
ncbi:MAG: EAL domain-containing protein [Oscillospiraceae bacterium]|nr:EAL domain-containing protein [Oscillospiraceae bacterium]